MASFNPKKTLKYYFFTSVVNLCFLLFWKQHCTFSLSNSPCPFPFSSGRTVPSSSLCPSVAQWLKPALTDIRMEQGGVILISECWPNVCVWSCRISILYKAWMLGFPFDSVREWRSISINFPSWHKCICFCGAQPKNSTDVFPFCRWGKRNKSAESSVTCPKLLVEPDHTPVPARLPSTGSFLLCSVDHSSKMSQGRSVCGRIKSIRPLSSLPAFWNPLCFSRSRCYTHPALPSPSDGPKLRYSRAKWLTAFITLKNITLLWATKPTASLIRPPILYIFFKGVWFFLFCFFRFLGPRTMMHSVEQVLTAYRQSGTMWWKADKIWSQKTGFWSQLCPFV